MATRKPLVLVDAVVRELPAGDTLDAPAGNTVPTNAVLSEQVRRITVSPTAPANPALNDIWIKS